MTDQTTGLAPREYDDQAMERAGGRERLPINYPQRGPGGIRQSDELTLLLPAFARAQMAFPAIAKDRIATVEKGTTRYTYGYANFADVQNAVNPVLQAEKLAFMMVPTGTRLIGRLIHESGQYIEGDLPIVQADSRGGAQALGSALTYAKRYLMSSMLGLVLDDFDDDGAAASGARAVPVAASWDSGSRTGQEAHEPRAPSAKTLVDRIATANSLGDVRLVMADAAARPGVRATGYARMIALSANTVTLDEVREWFCADEWLAAQSRVKLMELATARAQQLRPVKESEGEGEFAEREPGEEG